MPLCVCVCWLPSAQGRAREKCGLRLSLAARCTHRNLCAESEITRVCVLRGALARPAHRRSAPAPPLANPPHEILHSRLAKKKDPFAFLAPALPPSPSLQLASAVE